MGDHPWQAGWPHPRVSESEPTLWFNLSTQQAVSLLFIRQGDFLLTNYLLWFGGNWWAGVTETRVLRSADVGRGSFH